jgi:hypothetical protein
MKTHKLQFLTILGLGAMIGLAPIVRAQDAPATPPPGAGSGTNAPAGRGNRHAEMEKLFTAINATDAEKQQLMPIFKARDEKIKTLRDDTSLSREDQMAKRKEIMEATSAQVKGVLSADQYAQYEAFIKSQRGQRGNRGQQPPAN